MATENEGQGHPRLEARLGIRDSGRDPAPTGASTDPGEWEITPEPAHALDFDPDYDPDYEPDFDDEIEFPHEPGNGGTSP